jgi:hypothetical protein
MLRYENFFLADSPDIMKIYGISLLSKGYIRPIPFYCSSGKIIGIELRFERIVPWVGEAEAPCEWATRCRF